MPRQARTPPTTVRQFFQTAGRYSGCRSNNSNAKPVVGSTVRSMPRSAPTKNNSVPARARTSALAIARPGYRWPPVPPPAKSTRGDAADDVATVNSGGVECERVGGGAANHALAGAANVHDDAGEEHGQYQIRAAVGDE